jgi:hypothetical protein
VRLFQASPRPGCLPDVAVKPAFEARPPVASQERPHPVALNLGAQPPKSQSDGHDREQNHDHGDSPRTGSSGRSRRASDAVDRSAPRHSGSFAQRRSRRASSHPDGQPNGQGEQRVPARQGLGSRCHAFRLRLPPTGRQRSRLCSRVSPLEAITCFEEFMDEFDHLSQAHHEPESDVRQGTARAGVAITLRIAPNRHAPTASALVRRNPTLEWPYPRPNVPRCALSADSAARARRSAMVASSRLSSKSR